MKDLVLEWRRGGKLDGKVVTAILPNILGQKYVFGHLYPGEREGEEFIFTRHEKGGLDPTHCAIISVDDKGQYWIQNDTRTVEGMTTRSMSTVFKTFVNEERVKAVEIRLLKSGDVISLGDPEMDGPGGRDRPPTFCVKERDIAANDSGLQTDNGSENEVFSNSMCFGDSPLSNHLILSEIMGFLPVKDLKNTRLVCKKWKAEASKHLERRGKVSFTFHHDYQKPENSLKVFRYLHEMRDLKLRNLNISLQSTSQLRELSNNYREDSRRSSRQKMLADLRKLLTSPHNFSTLFLQADIKEESDFLPFLTILQELGEKLVELTLDGWLQFLPEEVPLLPLMTNLKKFTQHGFIVSAEDGKAQWVSLLVSLFSNKLEYFICMDDMADPFLQAFLEQDMRELKGIAIEGGLISSETLPLLLAVKKPLTSFKIDYYPDSEEEVRLIEKILFKHSPSLQTLVIRTGNDYFPNSKSPEIKFPSFPKLEEFGLQYDKRTRIGWNKGLDYKAHFPSLRKLTVRPPEPWSYDDPVFNSFFPVEGNLRVETVTEVWIPAIANDSFQPRMNQILKMFPSAGKMNFLQ